VCGLARDSGLSVDIYVDGDAVIAGKPAPTVIGVKQQFCDQHKTCGSGGATIRLARDDVS
jgi:hypothetical protein